MLAAPCAAFVPAAATVLESNVGMSKISDSRSTFLARSIAFFLRSSAELSTLLLYLEEKRTASSSRRGIAS